MRDNGLRFLGDGTSRLGAWSGAPGAIAFDLEGVKAILNDVTQPCYGIEFEGRIGVTSEGKLCPASDSDTSVLCATPAMPLKRLGDPTFLSTYGVDYAYMVGSMANAISSVDMVVALGKRRVLGAFGAGGLLPARLEAAVRQIQQALPQGPYAFNLIHSPSEPVLEQGAVDLYLKHGIHVIEASAYLRLTPYLVHYRVAGLRLTASGDIEVKNRVIAKVSRREVAKRFLQPPPSRILQQIVSQGLITQQQAKLAEQIPMADDITVEADSGGHTDNRPLVCILPSIIALRDEIQARFGYAVPVRIGAAGGISTPESVLGAFMMGAAYVLTGSVNHSCVEAGTSPKVKQLLAKAAATDVMMAPAADMFEMGVNLQVLKRGTLFPMRARKLYQLYQTYGALEEIPALERQKLEQQIFQRSLDDVWEACEAFFRRRDPTQITRAEKSPKRKMALVFRWYLGLATRWAVNGEEGREMDYQIWCGPAMGAFNDWVKGTYLEAADRRQVADIALQLLRGAVYLYRLQSLRMQGLWIPSRYAQIVPIEGACGI